MKMLSTSKLLQFNHNQKKSWFLLLSRLFAIQGYQDINYTCIYILSAFKKKKKISIEYGLFLNAWNDYIYYSNCIIN